MVKNYGISFGQNLIKIEWVTLGVTLYLIYWYLRSKNWRLLFIILGGGLNWIERMRFGYVTDYWHIPYTNLYNNVNDWLICIGVVLIIWQTILQKK